MSKYWKAHVQDCQELPPHYTAYLKVHGQDYQELSQSEYCKKGSASEEGTVEVVT
jgi:hypothetical protein